MATKKQLLYFYRGVKSDYNLFNNSVLKDQAVYFTTDTHEIFYKGENYGPIKDADGNIIQSIKVNTNSLDINLYNLLSDNKTSQVVSVPLLININLSSAINDNDLISNFDNDESAIYSFADSFNYENFEIAFKNGVRTFAFTDINQNQIIIDNFKVDNITGTVTYLYSGYYTTVLNNSQVYSLKFSIVNDNNQYKLYIEKVKELGDINDSKVVWNIDE